MWEKVASQGAQKKQMSREKDGALGYRTHITKKGRALRLMYWQKENGEVVLANIGNKVDVEIAQGIEDFSLLR